MKMPPKIYKVFDLLGFTEIFSIVDNEEAAISAFK
jgi:anti-anti-sigma regulatory factor